MSAGRWKVFLLLLPVGYLAMVLSTAIHEVLGHGLAALAVGGTFTGFTVRYAGGGHAYAFAAPESPVWHDVLVRAAGVIVTTLAGAAMCLYASRRKVASASGLILSLLGVWMFANGPEYFFWSGLQLQGTGDASQIFQRLSHAGFPHLALVRFCSLCAAAGLFVFSVWWGFGILWRHVETQLGGGVALSAGRRAAALVGLFVIPEGIVSHLIPPDPAMGPGLGRLPAHVGSLLLLLVAGLLARFPLRPFPNPFAVTRWHLIAAWATAGLVLLSVHLWLKDGVSWEPRDPKYDLYSQAMKDWKAGRTDEARRKFEQAGTLGALSLISLLGEEGDLDGAADVAAAFAAKPHADEYEWRMAGYLVATTNERLENWTAALAAWEKLGDSENAGYWDGGIRRLLHIARCRFKLGEVEAALRLVEECLADQVMSSDNWLALDTAIAYAEYAGRGGRLDRARAFVANLPDAVSALCRDAISIVEHWLAKNPDSILTTVSRLRSARRADLMAFAGGLIGDMGDPAVEVLSRRIRWGDPLAIEAASSSGLVALLPALRERRRAAGADVAEVEFAISMIEHAASHPASRRSSRPASRSTESR